MRNNEEVVKKLEEFLTWLKPNVEKVRISEEDDDFVVVTMKNGTKYPVNVGGDSDTAMVYDIISRIYTK